MALWRQAALGRLAEWFGEKALPADALVRRLGLAELAKESLSTLTIEDHSHLTAYAQGASSAWNDPSFASWPEFVIVDYTPEPWLDWHTLAVERLIAYLAVTVECAPVTQFCQADSTLHAMLRLDDFSHSIAWAVRHEGITTLFQRHVYGTTALSAFQEIEIHVRDRDPVRGTTLIGTPFFVGGQSKSNAWAILLHSEAQVTIDSAWSPKTVAHERLFDLEGNEHITLIERANHKIRLGAIHDSISWVLEWSGLSVGSDMAAWRTIHEREGEPFRLFNGAQLHVDAAGAWRVLGNPTVQKQSLRNVLIGHSPWAQQLPLPAPSDDNPDTIETLAWATNTRSSYAAKILPPLLFALDEDSGSYSSAVESALSYLQNWDFEYSRTSIGASVFTAWMTAYHGGKEAVYTDSVWSTERLTASLVQAIQTLEAQNGPNQSMWRWELLNPERRLFTIANAEGAESLSRFAPLEWSGQGHNSTPSWGTKAEIAAPAFLELWHTTNWQDPYSVRRRPAPESGFIDRHALMGRGIPVHSLPSREVSTTTLKR